MPEHPGIHVTRYPTSTVFDVALRAARARASLGHVGEGAVMLQAETWQEIEASVTADRDAAQTQGGTP